MGTPRDPVMRRKSPADHFKAGKLAGLWEALVATEAQAARMDCTPATLLAGIQMRIHSRIAALEEEAGRG